MHVSYKATHVHYKATHVRYKATHVHYKATHVRYKVMHVSYKATHVHYKATHVHYKATYVSYKEMHVHCKVMWMILWMIGKFRCLIIGVGLQYLDKLGTGGTLTDWLFISWQAHYAKSRYLYSPGLDSTGFGTSTSRHWLNSAVSVPVIYKAKQSFCGLRCE